MNNILHLVHSYLTYPNFIHAIEISIGNFHGLEHYELLKSVNNILSSAIGIFDNVKNSRDIMLEYAQVGHGVLSGLRPINVVNAYHSTENLLQINWHEISCNELMINNLVPKLHQGLATDSAPLEVLRQIETHMVDSRKLSGEGLIAMENLIRM